jgi:hypothetical protein
MGHTTSAQPCYLHHRTAVPLCPALAAPRSRFRRELGWGSQDAAAKEKNERKMKEERGGRKESQKRKKDKAGCWTIITWMWCPTT